MSKIISVALIAMVAHEANRAFCQAQGDDSQLAWADAPQWQKDSAQAGVEMHLANPQATPADSHASWLTHKLGDGWKYGETKDADKKEHPCCVPYDDLPAEQKAKDYIFRGVVHAVNAIELPAAVVPALSAAAPGEVGVTYIGRRAHWTDTAYRTGLTFVRGQARQLPAEIARKLLRHRDLFEQAETAADTLPQDDTAAQLKVGDKLNAKKDESAVEFAVIDQVSQMDNKEVLVEFALNRLNLKLAKSKKPETMRTEIIAHINRFGV